MADSSGPIIVRRPPSSDPYSRPGRHSHNRTRQRQITPPKQSSLLRPLQILLLVFGVLGLGYYGYTVSNQYIYQDYQNWVFDRHIAGEINVSFGEYLHDRIPFIPKARSAAPSAKVQPATKAQPSPAPSITQPVRPEEGAVLGRLAIPRLGISAVVREGVDAKTLSVAVGHVPATTLPGSEGNFAIAAHRDTLFRGLKDIRKDDVVVFQSASGNYKYQVMGYKAVTPSDVSVLRPDGGGLISRDALSSISNNKPPQLLTMITCYPFYYVGSAPKRFIVEAALQPDKGEPSPSVSTDMRQSSLADSVKKRRSSHLSSSRNSAKKRSSARKQTHYS